MLKRLNKFLYSSIAISVLMFLIGMIFLMFPEVSFETITYILSIILIVNGIYFMVEKEGSLFFSGFLTLGIIDLLLGVVMLLNPDIVKTLFPIVAGIVMVTKSTFDFRMALVLKGYNYNNWLPILIFAVISIICGLIIIINPQVGTVALTASLGFLIMVYSLSNIVDTIIFKKNVKEIAKMLEK